MITSQDIFGNYTKILVENKRLEEAARNELRYAAFVNSLSSFNSSRSLCRAYLQAIVLHLVAGNGQEALATWNDCFEVEGFMSSKSASYAQDLLDMCRAGDYKAFLDCVQNSGVLYDLDNTIARLLKKMKEETFDKTANGVGIDRNDISQFQAQGEEDEDDLC